MSDQQADEVAIGFIVCAGLALVYIIGKNVFYDCKEQEQQEQQEESDEMC